MKRLLLAFSIFFIPIIVSAQNIGTAAPDFTLDLLSSGSFRLSDQKGKVVFIFFFGSTCTHCLANGHNTQSGMYEVYQSDPEFVAVGIDVWDGTAAAVTSFQSRTGVGYPLCLDGSSTLSPFATTYDRIMVIDKDGIIRFKDNSQATASAVSAASEVVSEYLAKSAGGGGDNGGDMVLNTPYEGKFQVYPNPSHDYISIRLSELGNHDGLLKIFDLQANELHTSHIKSSKSGVSHVSVQHLPQGLYFLQFQIAEQTYRSKIRIH